MSGDSTVIIVDRFRKDAAVGDGAAAHTRLMEPALILEIVAESSRDPVIASAFDALDRHIDSALGAWLSRPRKQGGHGVPADELPARVLILRSLLDGLKMRQVRHPQMDLALLHQALSFAMNGLHAEH